MANYQKSRKKKNERNRDVQNKNRVYKASRTRDVTQQSIPVQPEPREQCTDLEQRRQELITIHLSRYDNRLGGPGRSVLYLLAETVNKRKLIATKSVPSNPDFINCIIGN